MNLTNIALWNWLTYDPVDVPFRKATAILGKSKSGKSTLLDLIQAVMTGGNENYMNLNSAAGKSKKRTAVRRSLKSYSLGRVSEAPPLREEALTYITLTFEDPAGKRRPVSLGLIIESRVSEPSATILYRFIADGVAITVDDFVAETDDKGGRLQKDYGQFLEDLSDACYDAGGQLIEAKNSLDFIREYLRLLSGGNVYNKTAAERIIRTFVKAVSFSVIEDTTDFVRKFLLEENDVPIRDLRKSITTYRDLKGTIDKITARIEYLEPLSTAGERYKKALEQRDVSAAIAPLASYLDHRRAYLSNLRQYREHLEESKRAMLEMDEIKKQIPEYEAELAAVNGQLAAHDVESKTFIKQSQIKDTRRDASDNDALINRVYTAINQAAHILNRKDLLSGADGLIEALEDLHGEVGGVMPEDWPQDPAAMDRAVHTLIGQVEKFHGLIKQEADQGTTDRVNLERQIRDIKEDLSRARAGEVVISRGVQDYRDELSRRGIPTRILFEEVEVVKPEWQPAAEAILNKSREAIFVDLEHYSNALEVLKRGRHGEFRGAELASTRKLDLNKSAPKSDSLASVLTSDDPEIMAYLVKKLGSIKLADTQSEYEQATGRVVMQDASHGQVTVTFDDGLSSSKREARGSMLGQGAVQQNIDALEARLSNLEQQLSSMSGDDRFLSSVMHRLDAVLGLKQVSKSLLEMTEDREHLAGRLEELEAELNAITVSVDPVLAEKRKELESVIKNLNDEWHEQDKTRAKSDHLKDQIKDALDSGLGKLGSRSGINLAKSDMLEALNKFTSPSSLAVKILKSKYRVMVPASERLIDHGRVNKTADKIFREAGDKVLEISSEITRGLSEYFARFGLSSPLAREASVLSMADFIIQEVTELKDDTLIEHQKRADDAAEQTSTIFRMNYLIELSHRLERAKMMIDELNKNLRPRPFLNERYRFRDFENPQFAAILELMHYVSQSEEAALPLFQGVIQKDSHYAEALRQVEEILLDENMSFDVYEDYRNYLTFDVEQTDITTGHVSLLSRREGTASGGENQAPFYVSIGAALAAAYYGNTNTESFMPFGIGLFDEAFANLDVASQKDLLKFYEDFGIQAIIAAPEEKRVTMMETMESILTVHRHGNRSHVNMAYIKEQGRQALASINPSNKSDDDLREMMEGEAGVTRAHHGAQDGPMSARKGKGA